MKKISLALVLALLLPAGAYAFDPGDLAALVAMPLAVAAVADISGVPTGDLVNVVTAMNRANVPPPQFVEVVRYVPVALIEPPRATQFVTYVDSQVDNGIIGEQLAYDMANRLQTYGVTDINVYNPPDVVVVDRYNYIPTVVTTRLTNPFDPLSLVAMPLAVAAVSQLTSIPTSQIVQLVSALNGAYVPPAQFVEIVRYSPAVFVDTTYGPRLIPFVTTQIDRGVTGPQLVNVIQDQYQTWGLPNVNLVRPEIRVVDNTVPLPPIVTTRIAQARPEHPFGGPPGQLKKQLGLQTGAEVVHGEFPGQRIAGYQERRQPARLAPVVQERRAGKANHGRAAEAQKQPRVRMQPPRHEQQMAPVHKQKPRVKKQHAAQHRVVQQPHVMQSHGNAGGMRGMQAPHGPAGGSKSMKPHAGHGGGHGKGNH